MLVYLRDGSVLTIARAATLTQVSDQSFFLTQPQYTDIGSTRPNADSVSPGAWKGSHWSAKFLGHWYDSTQPGKIPKEKAGIEPRVFHSWGGRLNH